jgi:hypothetical protein
LREFWGWTKSWGIFSKFLNWIQTFVQNFCYEFLMHIAFSVPKHFMDHWKAQKNGKILFATTFLLLPGNCSFSQYTYPIPIQCENAVDISSYASAHMGRVMEFVGSSFFPYISLQCSPIASWCPQLQDVYIMFNKIFQKHTLTLKWTFSVKWAKKNCCSFRKWFEKGKFFIVVVGMGLTWNIMMGFSEDFCCLLNGRISFTQRRYVVWQ